MQHHAVTSRHLALHARDQRLDVARASFAFVEDEIRVLLGDHGAADANALETAGLDEPRGMVAGRIREHRTAAPLADGLRLPPAFEQLAHAGLVGLRRELERRGQEPFAFRGGGDAAIGRTVFARIARAAAERGVGFVDAPVSGSIALAQAATLTALVGGSAEDVEKVRPALAAMTRAQHHLGDVGAGATVKLALATMIAVTNQSVSELLVLCERAGLERAATYAALADSAVASPFVQYKQGAFLAPDEAAVAFTPLLMLKDLALADALAAEVGAELPAADAARSVLERTVAAGQGDGDLVRVADTLRGRSS